MAFTMSSVLTTGGIRGNEKVSSSFQPRSFNMGMSREVFERTGGYKFDRYAEDIELSIRIKAAGFKIGYIHNAFVYHKRRTTLKQFFWQVYNFGRGRVMVGRAHPGAIKITHWFPSIYFMGLFLGLILLFVRSWMGMAIFLFYLLYLLLVSLSAQKQMHSIRVTLLSAPAALIQLTSYGMGFLSEMFKIRQK
jgi:GT2 family glycosyltransferase